MPGQHSPGYDAAQKRAIRKAAQRYRDEHPDEWRTLLNDELDRRTGGEA